MIFRLFRRPAAAATIHALYGAIVAQARLPEFYEDFGVPDTVEGRFDMIVLHLAVLLRRLNQDPQGPDLGQALFDAFCLDLDHNLREMGVGDLAVPKKMKRFGEAFYGRLRTYDAALSGPDPGALAAALARNVFAGAVGSASPAERLAGYARRLVAQLDALDPVRLSSGLLDFPPPVADLDSEAPQPVPAH